METPFLEGIARFQSPNLLAHLRTLWTWAALIVAGVATFNSIIRRSKRVILRFRNGSPAVTHPAPPAFYDSDGDDVSDDEDAAEEAGDEEVDSESETDFGDFDGGTDTQGQNGKSDRHLHWPEMAGDGGVVKLWDGLGLGKISVSPKNLNPRNNQHQFSVACWSSNYFDQQRFSAATTPPPYTPQPPGGSTPRVFVGYSIYKGKAALTVEPRAPEFTPLDSGAYKMSKEGIILLQFAPAVAARQYDWNRKQVFSLSVVEIGTFMTLGPKDSCEFFHDPFKGRSEEGKIRKILKVEPLPDGNGHFFNLSVQNRLLNVDESIYIPISKAEFAVLNSIFNFILPHLLGWQAFANTIKPEDSMRSNNTTSGSGAELECGR